MLQNNFCATCEVDIFHCDVFTVAYLCHFNRYLIRLQVVTVSDNGGEKIGKPACDQGSVLFLFRALSSLFNFHAKKSL